MFLLWCIRLVIINISFSLIWSIYKVLFIPLSPQIQIIVMSFEFLKSILTIRNTLWNYLRTWKILLKLTVNIVFSVKILINKMIKLIIRVPIPFQIILLLIFASHYYPLAIVSWSECIRWGVWLLRPQWILVMHGVD